MIFVRIIKNIFSLFYGLFRGYIKMHRKIYTWRNLLHLDNFLAYGFCWLFLWSLSSINFEVLSPFGEAFEDVEMSDVIYSKLGRNEELRERISNEDDTTVILDKNVVLVNIGHLNRGGIAELIECINLAKPKLVALDVFFTEDKSSLSLQDSLNDVRLQEAFAKTKKLFLVSEGKKFNDSMSVYDSMATSHDKFLQNAIIGNANMKVDNEADGSGEFHVLRNFFTKRGVTVEGKKVMMDAFPVKIAEAINPKAVEKLKKRNKELELIDFVGNMYVNNILLPEHEQHKMYEIDKPHFAAFDFGFFLYDRSYLAMKKIKDGIQRELVPQMQFFGSKIQEIQSVGVFNEQTGAQMMFFNSKIEEVKAQLQSQDSLYNSYKTEFVAKLKNYLGDKAVLMGFLGTTIIEDEGEDKFFTPLNSKYIGKANKDMYGLVVHANIISTILRGVYVNEMPAWQGHLIGILITYLVFASFRPIYMDHKNWYDGLTKAMGIILSLIILFIIGILFATFDYKVSFDAVYYGIILLAGDFLEIYYGLIKNVFIRIKKSL